MEKRADNRDYRWIKEGTKKQYVFLVVLLRCMAEILISACRKPFDPRFFSTIEQLTSCCSFFSNRPGLPASYDMDDKRRPVLLRNSKLIQFFYYFIFFFALVLFKNSSADYYLLFRIQGIFFWSTSSGIVPTEPSHPHLHSNLKPIC